MNIGQKRQKTWTVALFLFTISACSAPDDELAGADFQIQTTSERISCDLKIDSAASNNTELLAIDSTNIYISQYSGALLSIPLLGGDLTTLLAATDEVTLPIIRSAKDKIFVLADYGVKGIVQSVDNGITSNVFPSSDSANELITNFTTDGENVLFALIRAGKKIGKRDLALSSDTIEWKALTQSSHGLAISSDRVYVASGAITSTSSPLVQGYLWTDATSSAPIIGSCAISGCEDAFTVAYSEQGSIVSAINQRGSRLLTHNEITSNSQEYSLSTNLFSNQNPKISINSNGSAILIAGERQVNFVNLSTGVVTQIASSSTGTFHWGSALNTTSLYFLFRDDETGETCLYSQRYLR